MDKEIGVFPVSKNVIFIWSFLCVGEIGGTCSQKYNSFTCVLYEDNQLSAYWIKSVVL